MKGMTTAQKADKVFQSGLAFRIWNKPVKFDQIWDIRIFWAHMEYNGIDIVNIDKNLTTEGFATLDDCLDDMLKYLKNYE